MNTIVMVDEDGTYSITLEDDVHTLDEVMQRLVKPVLLAATYQPGSIREYIPDE